jgi:hypothetical protein
MGERTPARLTVNWIRLWVTLTFIVSIIVFVITWPRGPTGKGS